MTNLIALNDSTHRHLRLTTEGSVEMAKRSHVINLNVSEVGKAVSSFPVFLTKDAHNGRWALSALASFKPGHSLFVEGSDWAATYQPISIQTYPFLLIQSKEDAEKFSVGFISDSKGLSEQEGEALFGEDGKPSEILQQITSLLESDLQYAPHTFQFAKRLEEIGVIKEINIIVNYADGTSQTLKGLHTVDEDKMKLLDSEILVELNKNGYLTVIHAMLTSIYQLNSLIQKQSSRDDVKKVVQIKLETAKDALVE